MAVHRKTNIDEIASESDQNFTETEEVTLLEQPTPVHHNECARRWRDLIAFWFLGLCNNYSYVVMLTAAEDILHEQENTTYFTNVTNATYGLDDNFLLDDNDILFKNSSKMFSHCNTIGTGAILLADILPTLVIKLTAPFYMHKLSYDFRVLFVVAFALASFLIVGFSPAVWISILGVICASISAGAGEITLLSMTSHFDQNVVSTFASGTGGAGVFGALSYTGLRQIGLSARNTLFLMVIVPIIMAISYFFVLVRPPAVRGCQSCCKHSDEASYQPLLGEDGALSESSCPSVKFKFYSFGRKLLLVKPLLKYMIPLMLVYFAEYFINQALFELLYFENVHNWLSASDQYRWYQVDYQIGVFISRSSVNILPINKLWILSVLQWVNVVFLMFQVFYQFLPSIWIMFGIVLYEGLLGGAAYVNTFYKIRKEVEPAHKEFSLGVASVADTFGIAVSGAVALPVHNFLCSLPAPA